ncbi:hypothetical protein [Bermanella sp. R86510]|uniref:hypothetical protein n=1 Tax=unclassified Bermanella TaxID=2627862 RepID=UPI0037C7DAD9
MLKFVQVFGCIFLLSATLSSNVHANGDIGEHVKNLKQHLPVYTQEVDKLQQQYSGFVKSYANKQKVDTQQLIEYWEAVDFHAAIETNYVPVYAEIWQGIYGIKNTVDENKPADQVKAELVKLKHALWQALGAVRLAAQNQAKQVSVTDTSNTTNSPQATVNEIKHKLDRVVAKYAERATDEAKDIVFATYNELFEGIEGDLIEFDAKLVEDLEKDFNVTLPQSLEGKLTVEKVKEIVEAMQSKLDKAQQLLMKAEQNRREVF